MHSTTGVRCDNTVKKGLSLKIILPVVQRLASVIHRYLIPAHNSVVAVDVLWVWDGAMTLEGVVRETGGVGGGRNGD